MAGTVYINTLEDMGLEERGGSVVSLRRRCIVDGCTIQNTGALREALESPNVPQPNSGLGYYPNLILTQRNARVHEGDPTKVIIDLLYERVGRAVFNREEFQFRVTGGTGLQQIQTQFEGYGTQITLTHTFPSDDTYHPSETIVQGGEVSVLSSTTTLRFEGVIRTAYPHYISSNWARYLNAEAWAGGAVGTWLCTDVQFELLDRSDPLDSFFGPIWNFTFEFLYKSDGHQPVAIYNDEARNRPPEDLVANVGYKVIEWYPSRYFSELFPV